MFTAYLSKKQAGLRAKDIPTLLSRHWSKAGDAGDNHQVGPKVLRVPQITEQSLQKLGQVVSEMVKKNAYGRALH